MAISEKETNKTAAPRRGGDLFIVDNGDTEWKVRDYLKEWTAISDRFDIATGSLEIGALLSLDGYWQKLNKIRVLMGNEVTKRTKKTLLVGLEQLKNQLDQSIEHEKESNDFLDGVPAIVDALCQKQIECRVYNRDRFHAKAYITHAKLAVIGSSALVGSSNFSYPGLTQNVELNVQIKAEVEALQEWYEHHWRVAEEITPEILKTIERHTFQYSPFDVYAKALQEYFRGHEMTAGEWELAGEVKGGSRVYPILAQYQKEGYQALMKIARQFRGAFLCDGVGLGKTFIGLMVLERLIEHDRKRVALFVPKAARKPVWEAALEKYLPNISGAFANLEIFNHTDLNRASAQKRLEDVKERADVIVIDEAHHFRNPGIQGRGMRRPSRYRRLHEISEGKTLFMLTATPVNNRLTDLQHMIELFTHREADYFKAAPLGIHSLPGHFRKMEKELERIVLGGTTEESTETNQIEAEQVLANDNLFRELVVQRSRAYVKSSEEQAGGSKTLFPIREAPKVADYSVKKTYGRLLDMVDRAFAKKKPLFSLAIYNPLAYYKGDDETIDPLQRGRQSQVVSLIRTQFLKRFESSAHAFGLSCETLLRKLLTFVTRHSKSETEKRRLERWKSIHSERMGFMRHGQRDLFVERLDLAETQDESFDDLVDEELLESIEELSPDKYKVDQIIDETYLDMDQILQFLDELRKFKPSHDDKLRALISLLKNDPVLKKHKVLIFTEFLATAQYLKEQLVSAGIESVEEVDSTDKRDRGVIIRQFAPYYNGSSSCELVREGLTETRVLISTDVLSEGLNLQDATRLINYDLHWNPVRLMQRIGRVDRRMNAHIEDTIVKDHPDQKKVRGNVAYWNFLPPDELDQLLRLYTRVSHKTLRISRTFGIEGKKLLTPDDDYEALKEFNHLYEGTTTLSEDMHLEYQRLLRDYPELKERLDSLPLKVFSGKAHPTRGCQSVFFCYSLPATGVIANENGGSADAPQWTEEKGYTGWYLYSLADGRIEDEPGEIIRVIRSTPETPRRNATQRETLIDIRKKLDKHIKDTYLKKVQAPQGVKATLKAWMEIS